MKFAIKNHLTKILSFIMVLILLAGTFAGCQQKEGPNTESTTPQKEKNPYVPDYEVDKEEITNKAIEITTEEEQKIKELYAQTYDLDEEGLDIFVKAIINGAYAVEAKTPEQMGKESAEIVCGIEFAYDDVHPWRIYHNDTFYSLSEAYEASLLTEEDLYKLSLKCKFICGATIGMAFDGSSVLVIMMPSCNFKEYTPEDFSEIGCTEVKELSIKLKEGEICRFLSLHIEGDSKQNVLDAIEKLQRRIDIFSAEPNYLGSIED